MLHKLVTIKNIGRFENINAPYPNWDGVFSKVNLIFGQNRTGKTTLSLIFKSLSGNNNLIQKKIRFNSTSSPKVKIIDKDSKTIEYNDGAWSSFNNHIKIFDIHYIEENLYTGYLSTHSNKENLFEIIVGNEGINLKSKILKIRDKLKLLQRENRRIRRIIKQFKRDGKIDVSEELSKDRSSISAEINKLHLKIKDLNIELGQYSKDIFQKNAELINKYLKVFAPDIKIKKFSKDNPKHLVSFTLSVDGTNVHLSKRNEGYEAKYVLSEGDRNALAFSFFLSQLEIDDDLNRSIVIFDDPISSFDYSRKTFTINYLHRFANKIDQLLIFTHDIIFARDCYNKFKSSEIKQLKLIPKGSKSEIVGTDIGKRLTNRTLADLQQLLFSIPRQQGFEIFQ